MNWVLRENVILPVPLQGKGPFECVEVGTPILEEGRKRSKGFLNRDQRYQDCCDCCVSDMGGILASGAALCFTQGSR